MRIIFRRTLMFRKVSVLLLLAGILVIIGNRSTVAQTAPVTGRVELKGADGKQLTEDEARTISNRKPGQGASEEDKKAAAEYEAKKKQIEEKNKKAESTNAIVTAALKTGNEAFQAKNYDAAITEYQKGIE